MTAAAIRRTPDTTELLMRSRFTAYARQAAAYLPATWDLAKKPRQIDFSNDRTVWTNLEIVGVKKGGKTDVKKAWWNLKPILYSTAKNASCMISAA